MSLQIAAISARAGHFNASKAHLLTCHSMHLCAVVFAHNQAVCPVSCFASRQHNTPHMHVEGAKRSCYVPFISRQQCCKPKLQTGHAATMLTLAVASTRSSRVPLISSEQFVQRPLSSVLPPTTSMAQPCSGRPRTSLMCLVETCRAQHKQRRQKKMKQRTTKVVHLHAFRCMPAYASYV